MFKKICVTDRQLVRADGTEQAFLQQLQKIFSDREICPDLLILREKDLCEADYERLAETVLALCRKADVPCILNGHPALGVKLSADGAQVSFSTYMDMHVDDFPPEFLLGVSVHSREEAVVAAKKGAGFLMYGHVFETECKPDLPPRGTEALRRVCDAVRVISSVPVYAIGGIRMENWESCRRAGASGVCMMSGYMRY